MGFVLRIGSQTMLLVHYFTTMGSIIHHFPSLTIEQVHLGRMKMKMMTFASTYLFRLSLSILVFYFGLFKNLFQFLVCIFVCFITPFGFIFSVQFVFYDDDLLVLDLCSQDALHKLEVSSTIRSKCIFVIRRYFMKGVASHKYGVTCPHEKGIKVTKPLRIIEGRFYTRDEMSV